jgi:serine/threonine-protein kinase
MSVARNIDRICDEFEAAWQAGQSPDVEHYVERIDAEHREALRAVLLPLDQTYPGKLNVTVDLSDPAKGSGSGLEVTIDSDADGAKATAATPPQSGQRVKYFGEYELLSEIARGGMGVVYKAKQVKLNRVVALKMILSGELAGSEEVKRFQTEAEAAANLDHPGIVPIYEIGEHNGQHYFSMGYIEGTSLQGKLAAGPMPPKDAARLVSKIAKAVAYAHSKGVIHRDLKPANVLLDQNGEPKVTDFGLAKKVEGDSGLTRTGSVMGTPSYMPPEQALGQTDRIGPAADV